MNGPGAVHNIDMQEAMQRAKEKDDDAYRPCSIIATVAVIVGVGVLATAAVIYFFCRKTGGASSDSATD